MNDFSNYYNNFYKELSKIDAHGNTFSKIKTLIPKLSKNASILDIGCGHGTVSEELIYQGYNVYGMEINEDAILSLEKKNFIVIRHDITQPFNLDEKFELVLILDVLEHVFDPGALLLQAKNTLSDNGHIIISVPVYFDLRDRLRILFTGKVISYDNLCYGKKIYKQFRSFNYDHIRFFRPKDIFELIEILNMKTIRVEYQPLIIFNKFIRALLLPLINKVTVKMFPGILAHSMKIVVNNKN